jgi:hypothetical protein
LPSEKNLTSPTVFFAKAEGISVGRDENKRVKDLRAGIAGTVTAEDGGEYELHRARSHRDSYLDSLLWVKHD